MYVLNNLVTFLTHIWKLKLKHAVAIMNIKGGAAGIMGLVEAALIDAYLGHAGMLLITSVLYSIVSHRNCTHLFHLWHSIANLLVVVVKIQINYSGLTGNRQPKLS